MLEWEDTAFDGHDLARGREYSRVLPWQRVLVARVPHPRDWEIARDCGWYRIPCKSAPREHYEHIAFYFGGDGFGEWAWKIGWWANVESREVKTRRQLLPKESSHVRADTLYFKHNLSLLEPLERPIASRNRRDLVFFPTTLDKLLGARDFNDLWHESPLEDAMWDALKSQGLWAERQWFLSAGGRRYCLDFAVFCAQGGVNIECDGDAYHANAQQSREDNIRNNALTSAGWAVLRFSTHQIIAEMPDCLRAICATIAQRGGAKA